MAKEKRTALHPWQKPISKEEYIKRVEAGEMGQGFFKTTGQYYVTDMNHPGRLAKIKAKEDKKEARKKKHIAFVAKRIASATEKGKIIGVREAKKAIKETFKKKIEDAVAKAKDRAYKKGLKDAKPKMSIEMKAARDEARAKFLMERATKLRKPQ